MIIQLYAIFYPFIQYDIELIIRELNMLLFYHNLFSNNFISIVAMSICLIISPDHFHSRKYYTDGYPQLLSPIYSFLLLKI